eukprot:m.98345 g.98345  ORF g.98345 m.98345 type:complete len:323 (-) comp13631_c1_seq3:5960-6928(-)
MGQGKSKPQRDQTQTPKKVPSFLDPRSPTLGIARTPIPTLEDRLKYYRNGQPATQDLFDPRSPVPEDLGFRRTPMKEIQEMNEQLDIKLAMDPNENHELEDQFNDEDGSPQDDSFDSLAEVNIELVEHSNAVVENEIKRERILSDEGVHSEDRTSETERLSLQNSEENLETIISTIDSPTANSLQSSDLTDFLNAAMKLKDVPSESESDTDEVHVAPIKIQRKPTYHSPREKVEDMTSPTISNMFSPTRSRAGDIIEAQGKRNSHNIENQGISSGRASKSDSPTKKMSMRSEDQGSTQGTPFSPINSPFSPTRMALGQLNVV